MKANLLLMKLGKQDDVEAFIHTFEVIATREAWAKPEWAAQVRPNGPIMLYLLQPMTTTTPSRWKF